MSLVQKQAGASKGRKFGAHTASKRPSLAGIDMMQLFFKLQGGRAGEALQPRLLGLRHPQVGAGCPVQMSFQTQ